MRFNIKNGDETDKVDEMNTGDDSWDELSDFLNSILDIYSYRDSEMFVNELRRLEAYLVAEHHENESGEGGVGGGSVEFSNQQKVVDHLNDLIKVSLASDLILI